MSRFSTRDRIVNTTVVACGQDQELVTLKSSRSVFFGAPFLCVETGLDTTYNISQPVHTDTDIDRFIHLFAPLTIDHHAAASRGPHSPPLHAGVELQLAQ